MDDTLLKLKSRQLLPVLKKKKKWFNIGFGRCGVSINTTGLYRKSAPKDP